MSLIAAIPAAALGAWLGFANPFHHLPPLILAFPAGLAATALASTSPRRAFKNCWLAGFLAYCLSMYWVAVPVHDYGGLPWILAAPCPALLALYMGLYPALFGMLLNASRRLPWPLFGLLAACLWASLELARGWLFTGFPWLTLASALTPMPEAVQTASYIGAYGLSGLLAGTAVLLVLGRRVMSAPKIAGAIILALILVHGSLELSKPLDSSRDLSVSLIQGNIDQSLKWDESFQEGTVDRYLTLSGNEVAANGPKLIVWPETALPFYFQEPSVLSGRVKAFARDNGVMVLTGAPGYRPDYGNQTVLIYNRAYLVGPQGVIGTYDKEHLVPFGEYVPMKGLLFFLDKLVTGVGDFEPGTGPGTIETPDFKAGILICYETIFPEMSQARVENGADLIVNISNDAWFGRSSAPLQHLYLSALRAVEQRRAIVRGTNTGISAFIDPRGRILAATDLFDTASLFNPKVQLMSKTTFFHKYSSAVTTAYVLTAVLLILPFARYILHRRLDRTPQND